MNWKFWQNFTAPESQTSKESLPSPSTIPEPVARHMVVELKDEAEWVWYLHAVERPCSERKNIFEVRVFETKRVASANVTVRDYNSLDDYPELVVLQGTYNKKTGDVYQDETHSSRLKAA